MKNNSTPSINKVHHSTVLGSLFKICFNLILLTLLSWLLLIIFFIVKIFFIVNYNANVIINEILNSNIGIITNSNFLIIKCIIRTFHNIKNLLLSMLNMIIDSPLNDTIITVLLGSMEIIIIRAYIFILNLPLFFMLYFIFSVDGLIQRDIRKFQGARESTLFFHRIKPLSIFFINTIFFIYMVTPLPLPPELTLIPMILLSGMFTMLTIRTYKKYI